MKKEDKVAKKKNQKENHKTADMVHDKVFTQTIFKKKNEKRCYKLK